MTRVKICGITRPDLALAAAEAGADFFGLVFYPPSHRNVTQEQATAIVAAVRQAGLSTPSVGVFVNAPVSEMNRLAQAIPLDYVQLHGDEPWALIRLLERPAIKAVRLIGEKSTSRVAAEIETGLKLIAGHDVTVMLDSQVPGMYGGTGLALESDMVADLSRRFRILVAGGLTPQNVGQLVTHARPWGVDVSGGVETYRVKDPDKIRAFIRAVRQADSGGVTVDPLDHRGRPVEPGGIIGSESP